MLVLRIVANIHESLRRIKLSQRKLRWRDHSVNGKKRTGIYRSYYSTKKISQYSQYVTAAVYFIWIHQNGTKMSTYLLSCCSKSRGMYRSISTFINYVPQVNNISFIHGTILKNVYPMYHNINWFAFRFNGYVFPNEGSVCLSFVSFPILFK